MAVNAIWQDTFYIGTGNLNYEIYLDGTSIFQGKAFADTDGVVQVRMNDVCENYLHTELPDFRAYTNHTYVHSDAFKTFLLVDQDTEQTLGTYSFLNDYSYDSSWTGQSTTLSHPVNGKASTNMWCFKTDFLSSGSVKTLISTGSVDGYDRSYCGEGAIYYQNRYGGYDSLLLLGHIKRTDELKRDTLTKAYDNKTIEFGERPYHTKTTARWEANTGWLTDSQSNNLAWNLFGSNQVWFHDFNTNQVYSAEITDTNPEYKQYRNGRQMVNYTINLMTSQTFVNKL